MAKEEAIRGGGEIKKWSVFFFQLKLVSPAHEPQHGTTWKHMWM